MKLAGRRYVPPEGGGATAVMLKGGVFPRVTTSPEPLVTCSARREGPLKRGRGRQARRPSRPARERPRVPRGRQGTRGARLAESDLKEAGLLIRCSSLARELRGRRSLLIRVTPPRAGGRTKGPAAPPAGPDRPGSRGPGDPAAEAPSTG